MLLNVANDCIVSKFGHILLYKTDEDHEVTYVFMLFQGYNTFFSIPLNQIFGSISISFSYLNFNNMEFSKKQRASKTTPKAQMLYETQRNLWILSSGDLQAFKISTGNFPTSTWAFFQFCLFSFIFDQHNSDGFWYNRFRQLFSHYCKGYLKMTIIFVPSCMSSLTMF